MCFTLKTEAKHVLAHIAQTHFYAQIHRFIDILNRII